MFFIKVIFIINLRPKAGVARSRANLEKNLIFGIILNYDFLFATLACKPESTLSKSYISIKLTLLLFIQFDNEK